MNFSRITRGATFGLALCGLAFHAGASAAASAGCSVPEERVLQRFEVEVPGKTRVTRSVPIPAGVEAYLEAFETGIDARFEVRDGEAVVRADSPLRRWAPYRALVAKGSARSLDVAVVGQERAHGKVALRVIRFTSRDDPRCAGFVRAMASGDAAFGRGEAIHRSDVEAAPDGGKRAYEAAVDAYARAVRIIGSGGF